MTERESEHTVVLDLVEGEVPVTIEDVVRVAREGALVEVGPGVLDQLDRTARLMEPDDLGALGSWALYRSICLPDLHESQDCSGSGPEALATALIRDHCAGTGEELSEEWGRAVMFCRLAVLCQGHSGVRPVVVTTLADMLNRRVHPVIPSQGSLGAAGDLAPLAHMAAVLWRAPEGSESLVARARVDGGEPMEGAKAMEMAGLERVALTPREALALINGSTMAAAVAAMVTYDAGRALEAAELTTAMVMESVQAHQTALDPRTHASRRQLGQMDCAQRITQLLQGSQLVRRRNNPDAFSIRCSPQVLGACWDTLNHVRSVVERELGAATDNPLIFLEGERPEVLYGGNFHGAPLAQAMDSLKIALASAINLSERRIFRMTYGTLSGGLPSMLFVSTGLSSGFMIAQYTAASLASECKILAHPASVDTIPTCHDYEDHVSMAPIAARQAAEILENLWSVLAIEALCSAQALDYRLEGIRMVEGREERGPGLKPSPAVAAVKGRIRARVPHLARDTVLTPQIEAVREMLVSGELTREAWGAD